MKNDHGLIKLFQKEDKGANNRLVRKYLHNMVGFFYTITRDKMVAEDLAQDVFLKLFNTLRTLDFNQLALLIFIVLILILVIHGSLVISGKIYYILVKLLISKRKTLLLQRNR